MSKALTTFSRVRVAYYLHLTNEERDISNNPKLDSGGVSSLLDSPYNSFDSQQS